MSADRVKDRCLGAFVGLAVGDAIGTTLEFKSRDTYKPLTDMVGGGPFRLQPGQWTDDTSMALCLAESLLEHPEFDAIDCTGRWIRWWKEGLNSCAGRCFDIGGQTSAALANWADGVVPPRTKGAGNGGIMRLAPAVIRWRRSPTRARRVACAQSDATHNNDECREAAWRLAELLHAAMDGDDALMMALIPREVQQRHRNEVRSTGYVKHTLEAALWSLAPDDGFENVVLRAANLGDDADTVAAVTGQLAGARYGLSGIPPRWVSKVAWSDKIISLAGALYEAGT